jgi:Predicted transcriptional regulators
MEYKSNKPIYLQIADNLCDKILSGEWLEGDRIPSVRELGGSMGVNPNTIVRVYDYLQNMNVIYNKRGIGYFVNEHAKKEIKRMQHEEFFKEFIPEIAKKIQLLEISKDEFIEEINKFY